MHNLFVLFLFFLFCKRQRACLHVTSQSDICFLVVHLIKSHVCLCPIHPPVSAVLMLFMVCSGRLGKAFYGVGEENSLCSCSSLFRLPSFLPFSTPLPHCPSCSLFPSCPSFFLSFSSSTCRNKSVWCAEWSGSGKYHRLQVVR